ncbi:outer membrane protein [Sorangium cellulosum]|uniref:Outer membrane protein n=1 Tax=Sorangium cellulosum TaxID=56 RepID=A0A3S7UWB1_SORCE|nr:TonB-dependent receptor [Sorangium cellulosum]AUX21432.1 outer membrane protein [Sorangium cellulosum]AYM53045.1 outer membrane protein [Sorangium cellulosum]
MDLRSPTALRRALAAASFASVVTPAAGAAAQQEPVLEVTVHSDRRAPGPGSRDPSAASSKVSRERLRQPGESAAHVLERVPGVQLSKGGGSSDLSTASIRGATSAQTPIYLAGIRLNDDVTGTADLSAVPLWMIDRVEIYRGNAPIEADRLGIGGAIFFDPVLPRGSRVGAGGSVGSFGELATWAAASTGDARGGAMIAARRESARNDYPYVDDRGTTFDRTDDRTRDRFNADHTAYDLWSIGRLRLGRSAITLLANAFVRDRGVTGLSVIPAHAARSHVQRWLGAASAKLPCAAPRPGEPDDRCWLELTTSAILASTRIADPRMELGLLFPWTASAGARLSQQARLRYRLQGFDLGASLVQEFEHLGLDHPEGEPLRASRSFTRAGASVAASPTPTLQIHGLAAIECHGTAGPEGGRACEPLQPVARLGARLELPWNMTLLANVGRYVRVPSLGELYGTSPIVRGNSELRVEQGYTADVGARLKGHRSSIEVFGFTRLATDLIGFRRSSIGVVRPFNIGSARLLGVELTASTSFLDAVHAEVSLTALDPRDTSRGRQLKNDVLPFQARLVAAPYLEVYQEPFRWLPIDRIALGTRLFYRSSRVADPAGLIVMAEQVSVDVELSALFWQKRISARARLSNALDAQNYDVVGLPLPGRSVHGGLEVWW